jgi:hypothetical protein
VTANTELLGIHDVHRPVKGTHIRDTGDKKENGDNTCGQLAWIPDCPPILSEEGLDSEHD